MLLFNKNKTNKNVMLEKPQSVNSSVLKVSASLKLQLCYKPLTLETPSINVKQTPHTKLHHID